MVAIVKDATLRDLEGRLNSAFLGLFSASCGPSFSGHGYPTQGAANTSRPRSDRFWLRELRVSQHFSTFYGPSVQALGTLGPPNADGEFGWLVLGVVVW
jgi:hypothetical protein